MVDENKPIDGEAPKYITHEDLNKAFDARFGKFASKIESKFDEMFASVKKPAEGEDPKKGVVQETSTNPEIARLEKLVRTERESRKDLENALVAKDVQADIMNAIRGKVKEDWVSEAVNSIKSMTKVKDRAGYIDMDGENYSISDGIQEWLKKAENKKYLPAPVQTTSKKNVIPTLNGIGNGATDIETNVKKMLANLGIEDIL
jgi:hypothetical protein